jgi:hypothetical protein
MKKQIISEEFLRMQKLAGLITESELKKQMIKEMRIFDLKDKNGKPTELFRIENFSSVEDAIDMLNKYYDMGENEVDSFYTDETGTDYNYAYVANDGYTRFVKSLDEFSDGYQTEEEWGVASEEEIMNESKLNENEEMYGWEEDDLTDEELKKVKILMALKPYKNKIDKLDMDEIIPGTDYSFSQIDFPEQEIVFTKEDTDPEYGWYDSERHTFDFFDVDDKLLKSFLRWLNSKGIK